MVCLFVLKEKKRKANTEGKSRELRKKNTQDHIFQIVGERFCDENCMSQKQVDQVVEQERNEIGGLD
jgi:hypothetical protein